MQTMASPALPTERPSSPPRMVHRSAASRSFLKRGAGFGSLRESPDIAGGRLVFRLFVALAELVRELIQFCVQNRASPGRSCASATM